MSRLLTSGADAYLTTQDVAARYRTAPSTIRYWRHIGYGPKGIKVGRRVLYSSSEIDRFEKKLADQAEKKESA
ncbi:helix-turn-helix transcriptional regulator [Streptomyces chartreusis]|uniref:helix-turn-helix transcriptional regulator n=1 Tax=Streptomyces chartreusis TaxID=1969 RepID=UPI003819A3C2